jgi:hypothetical protein
MVTAWLREHVLPGGARRIELVPNGAIRCLMPPLMVSFRHGTAW